MTDELPEPLDAVFVGAHPDDVEVACGGTIAGMVRRGYRVGIVDLTNGEPTPLCPEPAVRLAEAEKAREILGAQVRITLDFENRSLFDGFDVRVALGTIFRRYRPALVLGIAEKTPMASPDHWQAMQITDAAIFYSRLTKWDDKFDNLPVHTVKKHLWYPLGLRNLEIPACGGSFVVETSETLDIKLQALAAYETQFPAEKKQRVFHMIESRDRFYGASAGFQSGEMFLTATTLGTTDLMQTMGLAKE